jgi:CBS domain-containing protein
VVTTLVRRRIGALVVCDEPAATESPHMLGIVAERDVLRTHAMHPGPLETVLVSAVMTREVVTASPDDSMEHAMRLMTEHRVRHLPVLAPDGLLCGIVSIGDLVKAHHDQLEQENHFMKSYIQGEGGEVATL